MEAHPRDDTRLKDLLDTAVLEVLQWPRGAHMHARIGSMGLRGSQEYRWVTTGPGSQQEMEEWLQYLDENTRTLRVSPFQLQWNQRQLVPESAMVGFDGKLKCRKGEYTKENKQKR